MVDTTWSSSAGRLRHGRGAPDAAALARAPGAPTVTVIVPAYNEAASIGDTIRSLQTQTAQPHDIIVVDDCSTDGTGGVARALGARVVRPPRNTGSKAGAQTFGLRYLRTRPTVAIDAHTVLPPPALARLPPPSPLPRTPAP